MVAATTISVSVAPDLLLRAQEVAKSEQCSVDEILSEALRTYLAGMSTAPLERWNLLRERFAGTASELGIETDEDIERLSDEYRASKRH